MRGLVSLTSSSCPSPCSLYSSELIGVIRTLHVLFLFNQYATRTTTSRTLSRNIALKRHFVLFILISTDYFL